MALEPTAIPPITVYDSCNWISCSADIEVPRATLEMAASKLSHYRVGTLFQYFQKVASNRLVFLNWHETLRSVLPNPIIVYVHFLFVFYCYCYFQVPYLIRLMKMGSNSNLMDFAA